MTCDATFRGTHGASPWLPSSRINVADLEPEPSQAPGADREPELTPAVRDVLGELRVEVLVRSEWRASLLRAVAAEPLPEREANVLIVGRRRMPAWLLAVSALAAAALVVAGAAILRNPAVVGPGSASASRPDSNPGSSSSGPMISTPVSWVARTSRAALVRFGIDAPHARSVSVVGDFNGWRSAASPLHRSRSGERWEVEMPVGPGRHLYAFLVDGALTIDPAAPRSVDHDFGVPSSVLLVTALLP